LGVGVKDLRRARTAGALGAATYAAAALVDKAHVGGCFPSPCALNRAECPTWPLAASAQTRRAFLRLFDTARLTHNLHSHIRLRLCRSYTFRFRFASPNSA
jgi:hypothetical protein